MTGTKVNRITHTGYSAAPFDPHDTLLEEALTPSRDNQRFSVCFSNARIGLNPVLYVVLPKLKIGIELPSILPGWSMRVSELWPEPL